MKAIGIILLLLLVFVAGLAAGYYLPKNQPQGLLSNCQTKYSFINPLLGCDLKFAIRKTGYAQLKYKIEAYINSQKSSGNIAQTSVYFRDLVNGPWFGIEEDKNFTPASLLKPPVMITYLKMAEDNPAILNQKLKVTRLPRDVDKQHFKPEKTIRLGQVYGIYNLIERMIVNSDNRASAVLIDHLYQTIKEKDPLVSTLREIGTITSLSKPLDEISVKSYASMFRLLFNSSYLSNEMSEKALRLLSKSVFKNGVAGGVPEDVKVAHKFGERQIDDGLIQVHDCGIVYFPQNPYIICVMTRGKDFTDLSSVIQEISKMVWEEVNSRKM